MKSRWEIAPHYDAYERHAIFAFRMANVRGLSRGDRRDMMAQLFVDCAREAAQPLVDALAALIAHDEAADARSSMPACRELQRAKDVLAEFGVGKEVAG